MASYKLNENAKEDLWRIYDYGVDRFGEAQADQYLDKFFKRFEELATSPHLYASVDEVRTGYRRSVCGKDSIYYRITDEGVEIMAIIGQQDTGEWI